MASFDRPTEQRGPTLLLSKADIEKVSIDKFIFHVVQHGAKEPVLLDDTPIAGFEAFFLDRVKETLRGNHFIFVDGSSTCELLRTIESDPQKFVEISKTLARDFHTRQDKRIKAGVLILMTLKAQKRQLYSFIKFDHEQVVSYDLVKTRAVLKEVSNSFTKSPDALHKSALIGLTPTGGDVIVVDRTVRAEITEFFKGFLNVKRKYNRADMTRQIEEVVRNTVKDHQDELPGSITRRVRDRFYELVQHRDAFDPDQFIAEYFGAHGTDKIRATFNGRLEKSGLEGERFKFDRDAVAKPEARKYRTVEGVRIEYGEEARGTVKIASKADGSATITVRTRKLIEL
jgi:hypothetical protein